jgi:NAD-dependent dihydropyrimidine dehydrogenase PreA subunit
MKLSNNSGPDPELLLEQVDNGKAAIKDKDRCMECGACVLNCPVNAVEVKAGVG